MRKIGSLIGFTFLLLACEASDTRVLAQAETDMIANQTNQANQELILLASPGPDGYYEAVEDDIFDFHLHYAKTIAQQDDVIVLAGPAQYDRYVEALGDDHVVRLPMPDIWMRDFSPLNAVNPVMMRYSAAGQGGGRRGQREADFVQEALAKILAEAGVNVPESDLINDGGNFVDDYDGRVVLSRKFLRDNQLSEAEARKAVQEVTGARLVAFIEADEQGGLEHADGVVAFIEPNVLVINAYPEDPDYSDSLKADLRAGLPSVTIHEIVTPYDGSEIYDERFGSACGLYTNMLVTPNHIYLPQFGIPEDEIAIGQIRALTDKRIIPVDSAQVCHMGGGVRCMSWQLRGSQAEQLKGWLRDL